MKMLEAVFLVAMRDLRLALRRPADVFAALFFFIMTASLFPLGVGPDPNLLRQLAPGVLWVGALLATLLALPRLFAEDFADGALEQLALSANPLGLVVLGKALAHWFLTGLPLALIAPLLGLQFDLPPDALWMLSLSLLVGTPALSGIGAIGAALTLGVKGGGVLLSLLILPLYIPALVFGAGAVEAAASGLGGQAHLSILAALSIGGLCFAPFAAAAALRLALE
jgi:heme exporter protein B